MQLEEGEAVPEVPALNNMGPAFHVFFGPL